MPASDPFNDFFIEVQGFLSSQGVPQDRIVLSEPPERRFGEAASNASFLLSRERKMAPRQIAGVIVESFRSGNYSFIDRVESAGNGFMNFFLNYAAFVPHAIAGIEKSGSEFGRPAAMRHLSFLIEHTSVNPNKEWHVGHLRNAVIGDVLVKLSRLAGHTTEVQNYIDDTGRQAAEAVFAMDLYEAPPPDEKEKFDEYVGRYYVRLNDELADPPSTERKDELEQGITRVLHEMENGQHRAFIERILMAQLQTAARIGATYDLLVWESDIVSARLLDEALGVLKQSPRVFVPEDGEYKGALVIELEAHARSKASNDEEAPGGLLRVLVRSNGLPTYTGKDIPYMLWKFGLLQTQLDTCPFVAATGSLRTTCPNGEPFHPTAPDRVINVVGEHQALQQQTVIEGLAAAGYDAEAQRAFHLSYGMVSQAGGKISGRKGSGISADDVLDEAVSVASGRIAEKRPELKSEERLTIAEAVAVGSVRYLLTQYGPGKPIVFDLEDVVSFEGNTGLFLQYAVVRMAAVLRRANAEFGLDDTAIDHGDTSLLTHDAERALVLKLSRFPAAVADASRTLSVNLIAEYAHTLAGEFGQFYRDCPMLQADEALRLGRLRLLRATKLVLSNALGVLGIPLVERL